MSIDAKGRQSLLGVGGQYGSQIHSAWTLGAVKAPNSLGVVGIHVHGFGTVAPARCNGDGGTNTLTFKLLGAGSTLGHTTDGSVGNHALNRRAVAITQV